MFQQSSVSVDEPDGMVDICVKVVNITGTVETPFDVNVTLSDGTACKAQIIIIQILQEGL